MNIVFSCIAGLCFLFGCNSVEGDASSRSGINETLVLKQPGPSDEEEPLMRINETLMLKQPGPSNEEKPPKRSQQPKQRRTNNRSKQRGWDQDRLIKLVKGILKNDNQDRKSRRLLCNKDQYYDPDTENCENCGTLCQSYNPKMCQVYCPGNSLALKYKLPQLDKNLASLDKANQAQAGRITSIETRVESIEDEFENLAEKKTLSAEAEQSHVYDSQTMDKEIGNETTSNALSVVAIIISVAFSFYVVIPKCYKKYKNNASTSNNKVGYEKGGMESDLGINDSETDVSKKLIEDSDNRADVELGKGFCQAEFADRQFSPNNIPPSEDRADERYTTPFQPEQPNN